MLLFMTCFQTSSETVSVDVCLWSRHIGENAQMVVIKNAGHAVNLEKPKEFCKHLKAFLIDTTKSCPTSPLASEENLHI